MTENEISEFADDMANLETALADRGFGSARVTAILAGAAPAVLAHVTDPGRRVREFIERGG